MVACAICIFFFQAEDGIRGKLVTGVQTCALPICLILRHTSLPAPPFDLIKDLQQPYSRRSEERRVGKECRSRWSPHDQKKKQERQYYVRIEASAVAV